MLRGVMSDKKYFLKQEEKKLLKANYQSEKEEKLISSAELRKQLKI